MTTTCTIALQEEDGSISAIGCWCDGCGDEMWLRLIKHYNTPERIKALLALGNIHWLGARLAPNPGERHDFFEPAKDVTLAYHRDDGRKLVPARPFTDIDTFLKWADDCDCNRFGDYIYLFDGCEWLVWDGDRWRRLEVQLAYMNRSAPGANSSFISPCGDDCAKCPRFMAIEEDELARLAELWHRVGWRDTIVSADEMRCGGCTAGKKCTYGILECHTKEAVSQCGQCHGYPCSKLTEILTRSNEWQQRCQEVCSPEEYAILERAFFRKKENLEI